MTDPAKTESLLEAYDRTLADVGEGDSELVVLEAEESPPTRVAHFGRRFPHRRFDLGGSEPTMMAIAAGLALGGRTVFASSTAESAAGRAYDSVRRSICFSRANVKIVATHAGLLAGPNGGGGQMLEDIGLMRGLPGMTVVVPADAPSTRAAVRAIADRDGPAYVRLTQEKLPTVSDGSFAIGRAAELRSGSDVTLVAVGALVSRGLSVAREFEQFGVSVRVLDFASVKPFDAPALLRAARDTGGILVLEEHSTLTGVGALVAATTSENYPVPVRRIGVPDIFGESGDGWALFDRYGLTAERIRDELWELLRLRGKIQ